MSETIKSVAIGDDSFAEDGYVVIGDNVTSQDVKDCLIIKCGDITIVIGDKLFGEPLPIKNATLRRLNSAKAVQEVTP